MSELPFACIHANTRSVAFGRWHDCNTCPWTNRRDKTVPGQIAETNASQEKSAQGRITGENLSRNKLQEQICPEINRRDKFVMGQIAETNRRDKSAPGQSVGTNPTQSKPGTRSIFRAWDRMTNCGRERRFACNS